MGRLGKWYFDGVLSGLSLVQSNATVHDRTGLADISNGQVFVQKIDGVVQFYAQIGAYSIPELGVQYSRLTDAGHALNNFYGALPQGYLRIAPTDAFSVQAGKLPTLIGPEDTFDFENFNIERGLLWNQEPSVSRGVQANYKTGPLLFSLSLNDGYYSGRYNWLSGSATWTIDETSTLVFDGGGNLGHTGASTVATPIAQNNSSIYNIDYTYKKASLTITPYLQYSHVSADAGLGLYRDASSFGGAVLANYAVSPAFQLAGRAEYIATSGHASDPLAANLLYGAGSGAFSFTLTPTYIHQHFFTRADLSVVAVNKGVAGGMFGRDGNAATQVRGLLEAGIVY